MNSTLLFLCHLFFEFFLPYSALVVLVVLVVLLVSRIPENLLQVWLLTIMRFLGNNWQASFSSSVSKPQYEFCYRTAHFVDDCCFYLITHNFLSRITSQLFMDQILFALGITSERCIK